MLSMLINYLESIYRFVAYDQYYFVLNSGIVYVQTGNIKDSLIEQESNLQKHTILGCKNYTVAD